MGPAGASHCGHKVDAQKWQRGQEGDLHVETPPPGPSVPCGHCPVGCCSGGPGMTPGCSSRGPESPALSLPFVDTDVSSPYRKAGCRFQV